MLWLNSKKEIIQKNNYGVLLNCFKCPCSALFHIDTEIVLSVIRTYTPLPDIFHITSKLSANCACFTDVKNIRISELTPRTHDVSISISEEDKYHDLIIKYNTFSDAMSVYRNIYCGFSFDARIRLIGSDRNGESSVCVYDNLTNFISYIKDFVVTEEDYVRGISTSYFHKTLISDDDEEFE